MQLKFWTVGKNHEEYVAAGINDFTRRITNYFPVQWTIIPSPKNASLLTAGELRSREGDSIMKQLSPADYVIALDEHGKMMSSTGLSSLLQTRANESTRQLIFIIGGAYGLDKAVLERSNLKWSLSALTFPHQLVRLILAEQVYRACSILRNEKYHHE